ncbi:MAG: DUF5317 family protein [Candidatus Niyogibacteria bacterium]|nr:DUF5317 family protein [Candidatus Niyogibacteria bacterium]
MKTTLYPYLLVFVMTLVTLIIFSPACAFGNLFIRYGGFIVLTGGWLNALVIVLNGRMPVRLDGGFYWTHKSGVERSWRHCAMDESTQLKFLGDRFDVGRGLMSIGDLLIFPGAALTAYGIAIDLVGFKKLCIALFVSAAWMVGEILVSRYSWRHLK